MKNIKELQPILTAIYCINQTNSNRDEDICNLIKYVFNHIITDSNVNMLTLICAGRTKNEILPELKQLLQEETQFKEYEEWS